MTALSDDFTRADSGTPGGSWTQVIAVAQLVSNHISATDPAAMYVHGTSLAGVTQYAKWSLTGLADVNVNQPYLVFRYVNSASPFYTVRFNSDTNTVQWRSHTSSADTTGTLIDSGALVIGSTATWGVTIEGTGNNTIVRVWDGITGLPSDTVTWNGNTSPNLTFTANPATACDTGLILGWGWTSGNPFSMTMDDWFGGDTSPGLLYPAAIQSINWPLEYEWRPQRYDFPVATDLLLDDFTPDASAPTDITGTLSKTLSALTASGSGAVDVAGTLAKTLASLASSGTGAVNVEGSLAQTLGTLTLVGAGSTASGIDGSLAKTLADVTGSGAGAVNVDGQGARTLAALAAVGVGTVDIEGSLAKTLGQLVAAGTGDNGGAAVATDGYQSIEWRRRGRR